MPPIIELKQASKTYQQGSVEVRALDRLDLAIQPGDFAALSGPSGSGKTTCLNLVGALDKASAGTVLVDGVDLGGLSPQRLSRLRRDRIGFVFQAYNLIPVLSARENAEFVLALQGVPADERRARATQALAAVGLDGLEERLPDALSGGQQQRVAIARAIAHGPAVVLADEPTANLDSVNAEALLELMQKLNHEQGVTFLFSTHDPRVMKRARRLFVLKDGRLDREEDGTRA